MWLTIEIPASAEPRLAAEANRLNRPPADVARDIVLSALAPPSAVRDMAVGATSDATPVDQATLDLIRQRVEDEHTDDPAEIAEAEREWEAFKAAMNASSTRGHPIYP